LQPQVRVRQQGLLPEPEQQLALPALQMAAAAHKVLVLVFQPSYSDSQRHFQTYITDRHLPCQRKLFSQLLTVLRQPVLVLVQVILQMPHLQPMSKREVRWSFS
jgi:hypothetical protein